MTALSPENLRRAALNRCRRDAHHMVAGPRPRTWQCTACGLVRPFNVSEASVTDPPVDEPISMGFLSLPAEVQETSFEAPRPRRLNLSPTPPDVVHAYKLEQARDRCEHSLVFEDGMCAGCSRVVRGEDLGAVCVLTPAQVDEAEGALADGTLVERRTVRDLLVTLRLAWGRIAELEAAEL